MKKQRGEESEKRREEKKKEDQRGERVRKKMQVPQKGRKFANTVFFQCVGAPEGQRLATAAGAEPSGEMRDENCMPWRREALSRKTFEVQML